MCWFPQLPASDSDFEMPGELHFLLKVRTWLSELLSGMGSQLKNLSTRSRRNPDKVTEPVRGPAGRQRWKPEWTDLAGWSARA